MADVAVIGAGIAGLAAADALRRAGRDVVVFEKSRGIGGRLATRRTREGLAFDHGAPCVHPRPGAFAAFLRRASDAGDAVPLGDDFVGLPGMSSLARSLAAGLDIRFDTEVTAVTRDGGGWQLGLGDICKEFAAVICTAPAPQTARLCAGEPSIAGPAAAARMSPGWTLMAAWQDCAARGPLAWPSGPLAQARRVDLEPGRDPAPMRWVAHARPDWTDAHLEDDAATVAATLLPVLAEAAGAAGAPLYAAAHRWRYARAARPLGVPCLVALAGLVAAGDWVAGPEAGDAFASGLAAAAALGA